MQMTSDLLWFLLHCMMGYNAEHDGIEFQNFYQNYGKNSAWVASLTYVILCRSEIYDYKNYIIKMSLKSAVACGYVLMHYRWKPAYLTRGNALATGLTRGYLPLRERPGTRVQGPNRQTDKLKTLPSLVLLTRAVKIEQNKNIVSGQWFASVVGNMSVFNPQLQ